MTTGEYLYACLLLLHALAALSVAVRMRRGRGAPEAAFASELLFALSAVFFLFSYIYATNANMDYVQRFMATHGNLRLAPDSTKERFAACLRYLPLLAADAIAIWYFRLRRSFVSAGARPLSTVEAWALPGAAVSGVLYALSFPSFLRAAGMPILSWVCLVPLLVVLNGVSLPRGVFYGTFTGIIMTMIASFWLGTFNLLTLQFVTVVTLLEYLPFMALAIAAQRWSRGAGFLVFPAAWTVFDWLRSQGFLGYPWGILGTSQYTNIPAIQIASLTGIWGVTFVVTLANSVIAWYISGRLGAVPRGKAPAILLAAVLAVVFGWGGLRIRMDASLRPRTAGEPGRSVRVALVQQDADPRKDNYRDVFDTLKRLTARALPGKPDLVAWSETAFVPNIRRWSKEDPAKYANTRSAGTPYELAALVRDFLAYQKSIGTWLLTGNDDYELVIRDGVQERLDYNGSVLFSPSGERVETYHKIHLVPFTEYFPFKEQLPWLYQFLLSFDAYLWEPGDRRVVFHHPMFSFSTPICFEDSFPGDVRLFVAAGAQVILNLSNDYWSQTDTEAMQHAANAVFRAVENRRPLARASASGLTCLVDTLGRITARGALYEPTMLVVDIPLPGKVYTPYTRWGDWFPGAAFILLAGCVVWGVIRGRRQ
ncbi:MAG TPA: apolipoprotein N-acyltransferase [Spirochaetia bacterium]|nr:apolipoprotein N-acyltransferase [Spirochaetia bacterium]